MAKTPKYELVGSENGLAKYHAKGIKPFAKATTKVAFDFYAPEKVDFPGLTAAQAAGFRKLLLEGCWAEKAQDVRAEYDSTFLIGGERTDVFTLSPKRMARFFNAAFAIKKKAEGKEGADSVEDSKQVQKLIRVAARAVAEGRVHDAGEGVDLRDDDRFTPNMDWAAPAAISGGSAGNDKHAKRRK